MSDRYLFKAKRTDNGEWVEGNLVWSEDTDDEYRAVIIPKTKSNMFLSSDEEDLGFEVWYLVEPSTICQYTGLHDATKWEELTEKEQQQFLSEWNYKENRKNQKADWNGKKIWEHDIVMRIDLRDSNEPSLGFIEYDKENTSFLIHWIDVINYSPTYPWKDKIEDIGNIFDNPELLER